MTFYDGGRVLSDLVQLVPHLGDCDGSCDDAENGLDCRADYLGKLVDYVTIVASVKGTEAQMDISMRLNLLISKLPECRYGETAEGVPYLVLATPELASVILGTGPAFDDWVASTDWGKSGAPGLTKHEGGPQL